MEKIGNRTYKIKCPMCLNKFKATADDFVNKHNSGPLLECPYCKTYLYRVIFNFWNVSHYNDID